jgi:hypothetical protein
MPRDRNLKIVAEVMCEKMECLWKPAQSGKTRTIMDLIKDEGKHAALNILICSNNRMLVAQTNVRMTEFYETSSVDEDGPSDDAIVGGVYSWMSGTKKTNIKPAELAIEVFKGNVSQIDCCAHKKRFSHIADMLGILQLISYTKPVNVWIDEADVSVKYWSGEFNFTKFNSVTKMTLVSATFDALRPYYSGIRVMPFPKTHPECYLGLRDCKVEPCDAPGKGAVSYLEAVLGSHPGLLAPKKRIFVPGDIERASHIAIKEFLIAKGCIVLVLNGETKAFFFPDDRKQIDVPFTFDESNPEEFSDFLAKTYRKKKMKRHPFAVTGQLCLGRGITFQSNGFTFDSAIIPAMKGPAAYQCVARVFGNVKTFTEVTPTIYMPPALRAEVQRLENQATNMARIVHAEALAMVSWEDIDRASYDTEAEYATATAEREARAPPKSPRRTLNYVRASKSFKTLEAAKAYYVKTFGDETGFASKLHTDKETGKFQCSFANLKSGVHDVAVVKEHLDSGNLWGQNLNNLFAEEDPVPQIGTVKVGYKGDTATFFLCVAKAGNEEFKL